LSTVEVKYKERGRGENFCRKQKNRKEEIKNMDMSFGSFGKEVEKETKEKVVKRLESEKNFYQQMIRMYSGRSRERLSQTTNTCTTHAADNVISIDVGLSRIPQMRHVIDAIGDALERAKDGVYGICEGCGEEIAWGRLEKIPWARKCLACKEKEERKKTIRVDGVSRRIKSPEAIMY
jgi:RNA polymerase-binding transcription factor DksA